MGRGTTYEDDSFSADGEAGGPMEPAAIPSVRVPERLRIGTPWLLAYGEGVAAESLVDTFRAQCQSRDIPVNEHPIAEVGSDLKYSPVVVFILPDQLHPEGIAATLFPFETLLDQFRLQRPYGITTALEDPDSWYQVGAAFLVGPRALIGHPRVVERMGSICARYYSDGDEDIDLFSIYETGSFGTATVDTDTVVLEGLLGRAWNTVRAWCLDVDASGVRALLAGIDRCNQIFDDSRRRETGPQTDRPNALQFVLEGRTSRKHGKYRQQEVETLARAVRETTRMLQDDFPELRRPRGGGHAQDDFRELYLALKMIATHSDVPEATRRQSAARKRRRQGS